MLSPEAARAWRSHGVPPVVHSNRVIEIELPIEDRLVRLITYYMPVSTSRPAEREAELEVLRIAISGANDTPLVVCGDSNASVGGARGEGVCGLHGKGKTTAPGELLLDWAGLQGLRVMNTWFQKDENHAHT